MRNGAGACHAAPAFSRLPWMEHPAMNVFKKIITRYLDNNGRQVRKGTPGAEQVREFSRKWYGRVPGSASGSSIFI